MFYFIFCVIVVLSTFGLSSFYLPLVCCWLVTMWYCSSSCCGVLSMMAIQTSKTNLISRKYQIMIINMLKNWSFRYFSHYFNKFVGFRPIYYAINLDIVYDF